MNNDLIQAANDEIIHATNEGHIDIESFLDWIYALWLQIYTWLDSVYPFSVHGAPVPVSLFWIFAGTFITVIIWRLLGQYAGFEGVMNADPDDVENTQVEVDEDYWGDD